MHNYLCFHPSNLLILPCSVYRRALVVAAEPLLVYLFVTWHLTSWQWSRVPKRRADVAVTNLWGGTERVSSSRGGNTCKLALSALLWTTKCHSRRTEMLDISMLCISTLYAHVLLCFFLSLLFSKCCSCCKTMHWVHFQRLSTERVHVSLMTFKNTCFWGVGLLSH